MALLHDPTNFLHILFNLLALWSLGPWVERALGTRRFLWLYLVSALAGSLFYVGWTFLVSGLGLPASLGDPGVPAIGASGAILGVLAAFSLMFPEAQIRLWFSAPLAAKYLIWLALGIDLVLAIAGSDIAVAVHVGGIVGAWLFLRKPWRRGKRLRPAAADPFRGQRKW
jgi:membrane associated rhomboid family serine protease